MVKPGAALLVVDDNEQLAACLALMLIEAGYRVLGPASCVADALRLLGEGQADAALVDFQLAGDTTIEPLLPTLEEMRVSICVITATLRDELPRSFAKYPVLQKPFSQFELIDEVDSLCPQ
jgi:CheY-like chemotaxis protein